MNSDLAQRFASVSAPLPSLNHWIEVAGTLDDKSGAMRLYIDGVRRASIVTSVRAISTATAKSISRTW